MNHSVRSLPFDWKDIGFDMATSSTARPKRVVVPPRRFGFTDDSLDDEPEHDDYDADPTEQFESDSSRLIKVLPIDCCRHTHARAYNLAASLRQCFAACS